MTTTSKNFNDLKATIEALDDKLIKVPDLPVDIFNQEAENLYQVALNDKPELLARGLKEETIELLQKAAGASRYAQATWNKERNEKEAAEQEWKEKSPEAYALRNDLLSELEFAFYDNYDLQSVMARIREGNNDADMIQDLVDLSVVGKDNKALLEKTGFDEVLLDQAEKTADMMSELLAKANGAKDENNQSKILRDKAYTYLKQLVDEVRRYGKFVFRNTPDHAAKYASAYYREH